MPCEEHPPLTHRGLFIHDLSSPQCKRVRKKRKNAMSFQGEELSSSRNVDSPFRLDHFEILYIGKCVSILVTDSRPFEEKSPNV